MKLLISVNLHTTHINLSACCLVCALFAYFLSDNLGSNRPLYRFCFIWSCSTFYTSWSNYIQTSEVKLNRVANPFDVWHQFNHHHVNWRKTKKNLHKQMNQLKESLICEASSFWCMKFVQFHASNWIWFFLRVESIFSILGAWHWKACPS